MSIRRSGLSGSIAWVMGCIATENPESPDRNRISGFAESVSKASAHSVPISGARSVDEMDFAYGDGISYAAANKSFHHRYLPYGDFI